MNGIIITKCRTCAARKHVHRTGCGHHFWPCKKVWVVSAHSANCTACVKRHVHRTGCGHSYWPCSGKWSSKGHPNPKKCLFCKAKKNIKK